MRRTPMLLTAMLPLAAACVDTAPPSAGAREARQCFRPAEVNSFEPEGDEIVYLRVGTRDIYRAELTGFCPDIDWSHRIAIRGTSGASWVCQGLDAELIVPGATGLDRCLITDLRKLSDAEARAWRDRH